MNEDLEEFIDKLENFTEWDGKKQVDFFSYFLSKSNKKISFTANEILECFDQLKMNRYSRTAVYLSESTKKKGGYIKNKLGYILERSLFKKIEQEINIEPKRIQVSKDLTDLIGKISDSQERDFLIEAVNCNRVEAYRATIIMMWILTIDHLQKHIFGNKLNEFNLSLAKNPYKKTSKVVNYDDFSELSEDKVIQTAREAKIISNDICKILKEKLGIRNSAAHPSTIKFDSYKATAFCLDLVNNIILKY